MWLVVCRVAARGRRYALSCMAGGDTSTGAVAGVCVKGARTHIHQGGVGVQAPTRVTQHHVRLNRATQHAIDRRVHDRMRPSPLRHLSVPAAITLLTPSRELRPQQRTACCAERSSVRRGGGWRAAESPAAERATGVRTCRVGRRQAAPHGKARLSAWPIQPAARQPPRGKCRPAPAPGPTIQPHAPRLLLSSATASQCAAVAGAGGRGPAAARHEHFEAG